MLTFNTAGESHGRGLVGIIEGMPAGINISLHEINRELERRQQGYGRGGRMQIEKDKVEIISGVRNGVTLGSPISYIIWNQDHENWQDIMGAGQCKEVHSKMVTRPRPGHADLAGAIKYHHQDMRNILERASARETAARVAAGGFFKQLLAECGIYIYSQVLSIGEKVTRPQPVTLENREAFQQQVEASPVRCYDIKAGQAMMEHIDQARGRGESLGGSFEVGALGVPPGLGSHTGWEKRLDARLAALLMGIPAIKAVEIGEGFRNAFIPGSQVHDEIFYEDNALARRTNRAGGLEGGISNGETIYACAYMKPIPTLYKPLNSVNIANWTTEAATIERSDICAVPAAAVVAEAMVAYGIAQAFTEKFGHDHIDEIKEAFNSYKDYMKKVWKWEKI